MVNPTVQGIATEALSATWSASAAIFLLDASGTLRLGAAAGVSGDALERLVGAVQSPDHPISRTAQSGESAFDVTPVAPGGPALRSHIAIVEPGAQRRVIGVLALAHQLPLDAAQRQAAMELARRVATRE